MVGIRVDDFVITKEATNIAPNCGYISSGVGHELEVLYIGTEGEEVGWLYARGKVAEEEEGWVLASKVRKVHNTCQARCGRNSEDATLTTNGQIQAAPAEVRAPPDEQPPVVLSKLNDNEAANSLMPTRPATPVSATATASRMRAAHSLPPSRQASRVSATETDPLMRVEHQRHGKLQLLTFGLDNCDAELVNRCMDWGGCGARARIPETDLRAALHRQGYPRVDLVLDARCFPDYNAFHLSRHTGVHPEIISRLVEHQRFPVFVQSLRHRWLQALTQRLQEHTGSELVFVVAVYCRMGKHRSVAVAHCLAHIGKEVHGFEVDEVKHLSRPRWGKNLCKGFCDECRGFSQERQHAFNKAEHLWRSFSEQKGISV